jgi:ABC-type uncharacterized transport system permease subunit
MNKKVISSLTGIALAMALAGILLLSEGYNPISTYAALFEFSIFDPFALASTLKNSVPLILTGLSASIAFASGIDNLGQPGQFVMGALAATIGGLYLNLPPILMIPLLAILAMLGGALYSGLASVLKTAFGMSEFIVTLMLNMIADFFTAWAITYPFMDSTAFSPMTPQIVNTAWLMEFGEFNTSSLVIPIAVVVSWFIFQRTKVGYEWRMMGQNALFARIGGCQPKKNFLKVMLLTGALAGLAGGLLVLGGTHRFVKGLGANYAWDGVMIAVVADSGIVATMLYGFFIGALQTGAIGMELITDVPREFILMLQAIILLVVVASREYFNLILQRLNIRRQTREREA